MQQSNFSADRLLPAVSTFPKSSRLRKRADFVKLLNTSDKYAVRSFLLVWQSNHLSYARLGVTVSKKIGCAVIRNKLKRMIREVFRRHRLNIPAVDLNVIARRNSELMDYKSVETELVKAFSHIGATTCSRPYHYL